MRAPAGKSYPHTCTSNSSRWRPGRPGAGEVEQELELGGREVHLVTVHASAALVGVEHHLADGDHASGTVRACASLDPPEQRRHPGHELTGAERLGHVIVGTDAEPDDLVGLRVTRRDHEHRHPPVLLDATHTPPGRRSPVASGRAPRDRVGSARPARPRTARRRPARRGSSRCVAAWSTACAIDSSSSITAIGPAFPCTRKAYGQDVEPGAAACGESVQIRRLGLEPLGFVKNRRTRPSGI